MPEGTLGYTVRAAQDASSGPGDAAELARLAAEIARQFGGVMSGEHGDGRAAPAVESHGCARRLPPASVAVALEALEALEALHDSTPPGPTQRRLVGLRWWDPDRDRVLMLAGG